MKERDAVIEIEGLWKRFRIFHERHQTLKDTILSFRKARFEEFWAIKDINIAAKRGETLGIIGRNGSGKSTLLKLIARILTPTRGNVRTDGKIASLLELGAGFQPDLTGRENIFLNGSILGLTNREIAKKFNEIVDFAELDRFIDTPVRNYSSGMYVRLGFSVAVHLDPDILLVDEVLTVGDEAFQRKCRDKIKDFKDQGKTILYVTHDVNTAAQVCDWVVMLEEGEIVHQGKPKQVIKHYHEAMIPTRKGEEGGTKEVEITEVKILDSKGEPRRRYVAGESLSIEVGFKANQPVKDPVFGIALYDKMDTHCFGTNTRLKGFETGEIEGEGAIKFYISHLPMLEGDFFLTTAIHSADNRKTYHWQERFYSFQVENPTDDVGLFSLPIRCELKLANRTVKGPRGAS